MGGFISSLFGGRPEGENPNFHEIQARENAERARREAEEAAQGARDLANQIKQDAERDRELALQRQKDADALAARNAAEMDQLKALMEQAAATARDAEGRAQAATQAAREDAQRLALEAQQERERSQKLREDIERTMEAAKREAEVAQRAADEQRRQAEAGKALAEESARQAAEETRKANVAKQEAEERLKKGIQPKITPTVEELSAAKRRIQYREDCFHFAIAGISGSGKSSLVNAFRGLRTKDAGAAAVGVTETTLHMTRYQDVNPNNPYIWYDVPGAGTLKCPDWQYFHDQGLYVFDCIIVLFDNRFTVTDVAILTNARRFNIPTYIVRSKADQHIRNIMMEMGYDSEGDDDDHRDNLYKAARNQFVNQTRKSVKDNLQNANLPDQRVYIVSNSALLTIVLNKMPKKAIDEVNLVNDLVNEAYTRRKATDTAPK